jgi:hypothetical protein
VSLWKQLCFKQSSFALAIGVGQAVATARRSSGTRIRRVNVAWRRKTSTHCVDDSAFDSGALLDRVQSAECSLK